ncbi:helix-turn-helix domain-containing protein [Enterococcus hirae]|uniref:helix-turn-helix domain-containing protein n=1 Tax=Enterococcus hirae TaxID=1354 RepID=UPI0013EFC21B|nr:helix-turn-helix domain-containing protein [Enterococcus hirae]
MRMGERIPTRKLGESDLEYYVRRLTYNMIFHRIISYEIRDNEGNIHYESIDFLNTEEALINLDYKNVYENVFLSINSFRYCSRKEKNLRAVNAFYCDIDTEKKWCMKSEDFWQQKVIPFLEEKQFPFPSLVVNSGRGLHLYWIITPVETNHPSVTFLYKSIQRELSLLFQELKADYLIDCSRHLRIAGTINKKEGKENRNVSIIYADDEKDYELSFFRDYFQLQFNANIEKQKKNNNTSSTVFPLKNSYPSKRKPQKNDSNTFSGERKKFSKRSLYIARIHDLNQLIIQRNYQLDSHRNDFFFIYANLLMELQYSEKSIMDTVESWNAMLVNPLSDSEIKRIVKSSFSKNEAYKFTNTYLIQKLNISEKEQNSFKTMINPQIKKKRKNQKERERYIQKKKIEEKRQKENMRKKEAYSSTKAMNQEKKQKLINRAIELRKKGFTISAIAQQLHLSASTIKRYIKKGGSACA